MLFYIELLELVQNGGRVCKKCTIILIYDCAQLLTEAPSSDEKTNHDQGVNNLLFVR